MGGPIRANDFTGGALGSAAVVVVIVQTPGLSQLFGCRPLGPSGWITATAEAAAATAGP